MAEIEHDPQVAHSNDLRVAGNAAAVIDDRPVAEPRPVHHVLRDGHPDALDPRAFLFAVVEHDERMAERFGLVPEDVALVERLLFESSGVGISGPEQRILRNTRPLLRLVRRIAVRDADRERVGLVPLKRTADIRHPVLAVVPAQCVSAVPVVILKRNSTVGLPAVPSVIAEREDFAERLPVEKIVADREVGFITDLVHADVHHVPVAIEAEHAGAIDLQRALAAQHDAVLKGRARALVDALHRLRRHHCDLI